MCRIISFVSVEGGVGQTSLIFELSKKLADANNKVCVIDGCFGYNVVSQKYKIQKDIDLKDFHVESLYVDELLNKVNENLYYIKTNDSRYDYILNAKLIQFYISEIKCLFDYILIDVSREQKSIQLFLECSTEAILIVSDREEMFLNTYKILSKIKKYKNILSVKAIINKARVIKQIYQKCLNPIEIEELLKTEILFVIPKFYKNNYFESENKMRKYNKIINKFCYSIITNKSNILNYQKHFRTPVGIVRKIMYAKFE